MYKIFTAVVLASACSMADSQSLTALQTSCIIAKSQNGAPLYKALGVSGYAVNLCTGQKVMSNPELAKLNKLSKRSWLALGYTCTIDCSGHEAGRQWAEDNDIEDTSQCEGDSQSFIEGCEAFVKYYR